MRALPALLLACGALAAPGASAQATPRAAGAPADLASLLAELDRAPAGSFGDVLRELVRLEEAGEPVTERIGAGFAEQAFLVRRARARLLERLPTAAALDRSLALLDDPDPEVRQSLVRAIGQLALADAREEERVEALARLAGADPDPGVRKAALGSLRRAGLRGTERALDELLDVLDPARAAPVAKALAELPPARARVVARVTAAFADPPSGLDPEVLAVLLEGYGRALADLPSGGRAPAERAPLVLGNFDPYGAVRSATLKARDECFQRLFDLGEHERAEELLLRLGEEGLARHVLLYRGVKIALTGRGDAEAALAYARALVPASELAPPDKRGTYRYYGLHLAGAALFARGGPGDLERAREAFGQAAAVLHGLLGERPDLRGPEAQRGAERLPNRLGGRFMVEQLHLVALAHVWSALCLLDAAGSDAGATPPARAFEDLRAAHLALLEARALGVRTDAGTDSTNFDVVLDRDLSPGGLVLYNRKLAGWREGRSRTLLAALGRVAATVMPWEFPGFEPWPDQPRRLTDPLADPERLELLARIRSESYHAAHRKLSELGASGALLRPEGDAQALWNNLRIQLRVISQEQQEEQEALDDLRREGVVEPTADQLRGVYAGLARLQFPSLLALNLAVQMRTDGEPAAGRALGEALLADLEAGLPGASSVWVEWASARTEDLIGATYMDQELPLEAERACLSAVRRLEAIENTMLSWGNPVRQFRQLRSNVLLALAVNANVRMDDQERALEFFEQAFELDKRDFMQVLRACYRARSGREDEARAVLRTVTPAPQLYYNLACTHALLGEPDLALDYLQREFDENHPTAGSRARQQEWARKDPDLASLRGNPRFERMVN